MKKIFYSVFAIALIITMFTSCKKDQIEQIAPQEKTNLEVVNAPKEETSRRYAEIGCIIYDASGNTVCLGKRYAASNGSHSMTSCKCVTPPTSKNAHYPNGMNFETFKQTWNTSEGRLMLINMGYYELNK